MEPTQPPTSPQDNRFPVPPEPRRAKLRAKVGGFVFAIVVIVVLVALSGGDLFSTEPEEAATASTTTTAGSSATAVAGDLEGAVAVDLAGAVIATAVLADFELACRSLGLDGGEGFCRCVRLRLPGHVLGTEIDKATAFLLQQGGALPERVRAVMESCTPAVAPPTASTGAVPAVATTA